jgi:hypothetical protein
VARIEGARLIKRDITGDAHPTSNRVPTAVALMLITVSKKNTLSRLSGQFGAFAGRKKNIASATKQTKSRVVWRGTRKTLERNATLKGSRRLKVNEVSRCSNSLSPEMRRKRGSNHHSTGSLKNMTMLALSHTILSMSTRTRKLSKSTLLGKKSAQGMRDILSSRICTKDTNRSGELGMNHGSKSLINRQDLTTRRHEIYPSVTREIIYKENIVAMSSFRRERSWTPNIRVNKIKRTLGHRLTARIW